MLDRLAAAGVDVARRQPRRARAADADAVVYSTAVRDSNVELRGRRRARDPRAPPGRRARARSRHDPPHDRGRGHRTARRRRRRCSRSILRAAGWRPSFVIGGEVNEVGTNAAYGDGEWLVVEADESDGTFLAARAGGRARHQRRARPSRPLRRLRRARRRVRASSSTASPGPVVVCADDPVAARLAAAASRRPHVRRSPPTPTTASSTTRATGGGSRFDARTVDGELGAVELAVPLGVKARRTRPARPRSRSSSASTFDAVARALARLRRRRPPVPVPRRARRRHVRRRLRAPPERGRRRDRDRARGRWRRVDRRVPAAPLHAHRVDLAASSPTRSPAPTRSCSPTCMPRARRRSRGVGPARRCTPCSTAIPRCRSRTCRGAPTSSTSRAASPRPGDLVLTLGAGDLTTLPDEWLARGGVSVMRRTSSDRRPADAARSRLPGAVDRDAPSRELTTYRCGGPFAVARARPTSTTRSPRSRRSPRAGPSRRARRSGGARTCCRRRRLRRRRARARRRRSSAIDVDATVAVGAAPAARCRFPCWPAGRPRPGVGGLEFFVGIPGSRRRRGADERGRPRRRDRDVLVERRVLDLLDDGADVRRARRRASASATAVAAWRPRDVVVGGRVRRRRPTIPTRASADRRDRALAARAPARRPERGIGVHEPARRRRRPAHRRRRLQGPAGRRRGGVGEARQLLRGRARRAAPTCTCWSTSCAGRSRRVPSRVASTLEPELQLVGFAERDRSRMKRRHRATEPSASSATARSTRGSASADRGIAARRAGAGCASCCVVASVIVRRRPGVPDRDVAVPRRRPHRGSAGRVT